MATPTAEQLVLTGPPHDLAANARLDPAGARVAVVRMRLPDGGGVYRAHIRPHGPGGSRFRLRLPRATPPGTYRGETVVADRQIDVVADVLPAPRLRLEPRSSTHAAPPGGRVELLLHLANGGNVPCGVPKSVTFDLDDADGQDRSLGRALRAQLEESERRVDRLFEELREAHGGEARVSVLEGAGPLAPGEERALRCLLEVPGHARAGRTYAGALALAGAGHLVVVSVVSPGPYTRGRIAS